MLNFNYFLILSLITTFNYFNNAENTVHWQWRDLICKTGKTPEIVNEPAYCEVALRESEKNTTRHIAPANACFDETHNNTVRTYCDLLCPEADTVYLIKRDPQVHRHCFVFYTHRLEKRGNDWYIWRDKNCRNSEITFTARCEFNFSRSKFPDDQKIFDHLLRRN